MDTPTEEKKSFEKKEIAYSEELQIKNQKVMLELRERREYLDQRKVWSNVLLGIILFLVLFTFLFTLEVGTENWIFKDEWLVRLIYVTFFASIVSLANIVVNFLFPKKKEDQQAPAVQPTPEAEQPVNNN